MNYVKSTNNEDDHVASGGTAAMTRTETTTVVRKLRILEIRCLDGPDAGSTQTFTVPRIKVGCSPACHVVVVDPSVSPLHCELCIRGDHVELRDLGSTHGTFLDGRRVYRVELRLGDRFFAGQVGFELLEAREVEVPVSVEDCFEQMWGASPHVREVFARLDRLAGTPLTVLIAGETGTGKEVAARSLHLRSGRSGDLVVHDCASVIPNGLEDAFEEADGGTLLLDELSELPPEQQPRLRRILDRREVQRSGETDGRPVDVRIVASTRADLPRHVADKRFREDLYFRVAQAAVELPPLRERGEDIELLASLFINELAELEGRLPPKLMDDARQVLREHDWPGNVRELRNVIQRTMNLARGPRIYATDLPLHDHGRLMGVEELLALPYKTAHQQLDRYYLRRTMNECRGNITRAAKRLDTSRRALRERLKRLGLYSAE